MEKSKILVEGDFKIIIILQQKALDSVNSFNGSSLIDKKPPLKLLVLFH